MYRNVAAIVALIAAFVITTHAQLPDGIADRPSTTDPSYTRCEGPVDEQCGYDALFCTPVSYGGNRPTPTGCRTGTVREQGPVSRATFDDLNVCNCPVGQYALQLIDQPEPTGSCVPFTKLGQVCTIDAQCVERRGRHAGSDNLVTDDPDGRLFCISGRCSPCSPMEWATSTRFAVPVGQPYTCPGIDGPQSEIYDTVVFGSSRPGETRTCHPNGTITGAGAIDFSLVSQPFSGDTPATTATTTAGDTTSGAAPACVVALYATAVAVLATLL